MEVVLALGRTPTARELAGLLNAMGIAFRVAEGGRKGTDCILVYDSPELAGFETCRESLYLDPRLDPLVASARIASKALAKRVLRVGIDLGVSGATAAIIVNGRPLGIRYFTDIDELEDYLCTLLESFQPQRTVVNVGAEGARNAGLLLETLCGIRVNIVGEGQTNKGTTPLHHVLRSRSLRRRDWTAALNIALH